MILTALTVANLCRGGQKIPLLSLLPRLKSKVASPAKEGEVMAIGIMSILFILLFIVMNPTVGVLLLLIAPIVLGVSAFSTLPSQ